MTPEVRVHMKDLYAPIWLPPVLAPEGLFGVFFLSSKF